MLFASTAKAQMIDPQTAGYTYVLAFPDTSSNTYDTRYQLSFSTKMYAMVYSASPNTRMRLTNTTTKKDTTYILPQGKILRLGLGKDLVKVSNTPSNSTWVIESEDPIVVYCLLITPQGSEAWSALPVERWGKEYIANLMPGGVINDIMPGGEYNYTKKYREAPAELLIIAAFDNTNVVIKPSAKTVPQKDSITVSLKKYQAYQIQSWVDTSQSEVEIQQPDISGTHIIADQPIGVVCATTRSANRELEAAGLGQNTFKNPLIESIAPIEQWGKEFVYTPTWDSLYVPDTLSQKRPYEWAKFITTDTTTPVALLKWQQTDNTTETFTILGRSGKTMRIDTPSAAWFQADKPVSAMMSTAAVVRYKGIERGFSNYVGAEYESSAPPYMVEMVPREQWGYAAPIIAIREAYLNFVNIVTDNASQPRLRLMNDNVEIQWPSTWSPISNSTLVWSSFSLPHDATYLVYGADTNVRFSGFVYGFRPGAELYRPGKIKKSDKPHLMGSSNNYSGGPQLMHPSEYEEHYGFGYGYPLAPRRNPLLPGTSSVPLLSPKQSQLDLRILSANPFQNIVELECSLLQSQYLFARISDVLGKTVATLHDGMLTSGIHQLQWHSKEAAPGLYFCELISKNGRTVVPLMLTR